MKNNQDSQLSLISSIYVRKLQRLEIRYQKSRRELEQERSLLVDIEKDMERAVKELGEEKQAWVIRAESETQTREKIMNMRHVLHLLEEKIVHVQTRIKDQNQKITEHERITKELKKAVEKMNIKVEKLSFAQEQYI